MNMGHVMDEFHQLLDAAPDAMVVVDRAGNVAAVNLEAERFFGWLEEELVGHPLTRIVPRSLDNQLNLILDAQRASHAVVVSGAMISCSASRRDGTAFPVELSRRSLGSGYSAKSLVTLRDRSEWSRAEGNRSRNNEQARITLASLGDALITTDINCRVTYLNPVAERLTGWTADEARGHPLALVVPLIAEATRASIPNTAARCLEEGRSIDLEDGVLLRRRDGTEVPVGDSTAPVRDRLGQVTGVVMVIQDESEKRRVGNRLSFEAAHDSLTGLVNRRELERRLRRVLEDLAATPSDQVLLCIDLDRFKAVNDTSGHEAGDLLLKRVSEIISSGLRKRDTLARVGGDEFCVLLEHCPPVEAERIASDIQAKLDQFRFEWAGTIHSLSASIGLVGVAAQDGGLAAVLRAGDAACYQAKQAGGNRVHIDTNGLAHSQLSRKTERGAAQRSIEAAGRPAPVAGR
jgi:diguanylate cyclase (GGDEF)-like protein/PAS domain S-box-containing protein